MAIEFTIDEKDRYDLVQSWALCLYSVGLFAIPYLGGEKSPETNHWSLIDKLPLRIEVERMDYSGHESD